ncbi:hypothetical protein [Streptomyces avermitilis]|uniref:hypothetical protein n=1 Tax=Streptomyces avermitilis TaxID=33903 RepID=UPI0033A62708
MTTTEPTPDTPPDASGDNLPDTSGRVMEGPVVNRPGHAPTSTGHCPGHPRPGHSGKGRPRRVPGPRPARRSARRGVRRHRPQAQPVTRDEEALRARTVAVDVVRLTP